MTRLRKSIPTSSSLRRQHVEYTVLYLSFLRTIRAFPLKKEKKNEFQERSTASSPRSRSMTLAANDAFSFALAHNGPRRRSSTRSPSPISSVGLFPQAQSAKGIHNIKRQVIRRLSNLQPVPTEVTDAATQQQSHGQSSHSARQEPMTTPRDPPPSSHASSIYRYWEIPRKALHSSIGTSFVPVYTQPAFAHHPRCQASSPSISMSPTGPQKRSCWPCAQLLPSSYLPTSSASAFLHSPVHTNVIWDS